MLKSLKSDTLQGNNLKKFVKMAPCKGYISKIVVELYPGWANFPKCDKMTKYATLNGEMVKFLNFAISGGEEGAGEVRANKVYRNKMFS